MKIEEPKMTKIEVVLSTIAQAAMLIMFGLYLTSCGMMEPGDPTGRASTEVYPTEAADYCARGYKGITDGEVCFQGDLVVCVDGELDRVVEGGCNE